ncbi:hypothetical protein MRX96_015711 [Rhipicephalus microplus]
MNCVARLALLRPVQATALALAMPKAKKRELLVVLVLAAVVTGAPPYQCKPEPAPNCSLVFPSILFLNPCQYVCFERLLLPSITVRKHNDGTLCTPAFGFLGIGTCHNGTCVQPTSHGPTTVQPGTRPPPRDTFLPRDITASHHPRGSTVVPATTSHTGHSTGATAARTAATVRPVHIMP